MTDQTADRLRAIKTFPSLVKYLRDELDWPIESENFDDLTFEYQPEELGLDAKTAVKIKEIKQLRPLVRNQPWGIFFINFEPKSLPVIALRRILSHLVIKKRKSANNAERPAWAPHDLLFISSYGEADHRDITFAQFSEDAGDLPSLRVLSWDDENTVARLEHTHHTLREKLHWPENTSDLDSWRKSWSSAFTLKPREVVNTAKALAIRLAELATVIRKRVNKILKIESDKGPLRTLHTSFREALIHDLNEDDFADMYAQTITYGLLSARVSRPAGLVAENIADMVPVTNPFLRDLLSTFLTIGGRKGKIDFDEVGINEVVQVLRDANMEAVLRDFGDRNPQEDPVVHFYELFLKEYDPKKRMQRGVFYTPRPVVSYIVRSVDEILRKEFGLADGLADTATWDQMVKGHPEIKIPEGAKTDDSFVQILDPATGTGTFLVEVIDVIYKTMTTKWQGEGHNKETIKRKWNEYVPDHLLPRLYGFELMMAPYAVAHMKIGLKLHDTGYNFKSHERARIYLTNSLEPAHGFSGQLELDAPALAHEAQAVNEVKAHKRFTVVIGNPPYSIQSANLNETVRRLVEDYKFVDSKRIKERNALQFEKNLQDDYVKFIRLAELCIRASGPGIVGYISNDSFLDSRSFRGMRQHLIASFPAVSILDLHGSQKKSELNEQGERDENVFDIQQGVCISVMRNAVLSARVQRIERTDQLGTRSAKYDFLLAHSLSTTTWNALNPASPFYLFYAFENGMGAECSAWPSLRDIVTKFSSGIKTHKDRFAYAFTAQEMRDRLQEFVASHVTENYLRTEYALKDTPLWQLAVARQRLRKADAKPPVVMVLYRPFDFRSIVYSDDIVRYTARPTMQHLDGKENVALLVSQQQITEGFAHAFVTRVPADWGSVSNKSRESTSVFPLFLREGGFDQRAGELFEDSEFRNNFTPVFLKLVSDSLGEKPFSPREVFDYCYAIFHSLAYRSRYASLLKSDFPHLPLTSSLELFRTLANLGGELVALHLLESAKLDKPITKWRGITPSSEVEKITYFDEMVWIDKAKIEGFQGVPESVWNFHIGGYQVCEKWLKDRKGRQLSKDDITHYQKIVVALNETIRLMKEIDAVIEKYGGWPGAFATQR